MEIPKFDIRWLVEGMHVATPDAEIKADIRRRAKGWPEEKIVEAEDYAVECMNENRQLCKDFRL